MKDINAVIVAAILSLASCTARPVAYPISSSHSQITASGYDDAEAAFSGGLAPLPYELAAMDCQELLTKRDTAGAFVLGLAGLSGAGGLATLIPKDATPEESKRWDLGLGISALAVGTTAVILGALVRSWSTQFEERCGVEGQKPVEHPASDEVEAVDGGVE